MSKLLVFIGAITIVVMSAFYIVSKSTNTPTAILSPDVATIDKPIVSTSPTPTVISSPTPIASPTATPTLSPAEYNKIHGPCVTLPVLMYHHIQEAEAAKTGKYTSLNVTPENFRTQMNYLKSKGYNPIGPATLISFFDSGVAVPKKSILLTFDDGYQDFYQFAAPILKELNYPSIMFLPTGLLENPGYLTWSEIKELAGNSLFYFANHTWSHHNMSASQSVVEKEVGTAATQLAERNLDSLKLFAYPYGLEGNTAINYLSKNGYKLAFSTVSGSLQCKADRLSLPRIRIGNANLNSYGL